MPKLLPFTRADFVSNLVNILWALSAVSCQWAARIVGAVGSCCLLLFFSSRHVRRRLDSKLSFKSNTPKPHNLALNAKKFIININLCKGQGTLWTSLKYWSIFLRDSDDLYIPSRVIYKVDHRSYDRAKTHMIGQNLFARSSWSSRIFTKLSSIIS